MGANLLGEAFDYLYSFTIPSIDENTNFWMVRSKGGYFYEEFVKEEFIALGWNYINKSTVINSHTMDILKDGIKERYGDKVPMTAINKCRRFIEEIKEGDYAIIPNAGSSKIAICKIGEYFEQGDDDYKKENSAIAKINNKECEIDEIKCPYLKRRKIKVILQVPTSRVNYNILRALSSYHGLSNMNEYAMDVMSCIYDCFEYENKLIFNINVAKKEAIKPRELAVFMYGITEFFSNIADEDDLSTTLNLNSPGKVRVTLKNGFQSLKNKVLPFVAIYIAVVGGSGFGFEFPGLVGFIKEVQTLEIEKEKAQAELDAQKLENYEKAIKLIQDAEECGIDIEEVLKSLETLDGLNKNMNFESNVKFANIKESEK